MKAYISNIQHFNVHDGNGFRTTVFFQGCNLRCKWCQNPELISKKPIMLFDCKLCRGCEECIKVCNTGALKMAHGVNDKEFITYENELCVSCLKCEDVCYYGARTFSSHEMSLGDVLKECLKEKAFYKYHFGGVTLSGGEPLLQKDFSVELLKQIKKAGVSTTIETAGCVPFENIEEASQYTDYFYYDLKLIDKEKSRKYLGNDSNVMLENLTRLSHIHKQIVIRIPLIPSVNDTDVEFGSLMEHIKGLGGIRYIHILPFHQLGSSKYKLAGIQYDMYDLSENEQNVERCKSIAEHYGYIVDVGGTAFAYMDI